MSVVSYISDKLSNLVANLGTGRDKAAAAFYELPRLSEVELATIYRAGWLGRKIVDIPAEDSVRRWREWRAESDQITRIEAEESRLGVRQAVIEALKSARLFGWSGVLIGTADKDLSLPLSPDRLGQGGITHLAPLSSRYLTVTGIGKDPTVPGFGRPSAIDITADGVQRTVHPSRMVLLRGARMPDQSIDELTTGLGVSVIEAALEAMRNADSVSANAASLVYEARVDVLKVPRLMHMLTDPEQEKLLLSRFRLAATLKGNNGMLLLDSEEDYEQKSYGFAGLVDLIRSYLLIVSGAADIPATRLLGQSPTGLTQTAEHDVRNYYDKLQASQELELRPALATLDEALIRSALGDRPPEIYYEWASLWQTSDTERSEISERAGKLLKDLVETALWPPDVLSEAGANLLTEIGAVPGLEGALKEFAEMTGGEDEE